MDDVFGLIVMFVIYLLSVSVGGKKKKKKQKRQMPNGPRMSGPMRTAAQGELADRRQNARTQRTMDGFAQAFEETPDRSKAPCQDQPIHLHAASQQMMNSAAEGEDPCHAGGIAYAQVQQEGETDNSVQDAAMQDVLRGVIMSEILTRPCERMTMNKNRRRI